MKYHKLCGLNIRNVLSRGFGDEKSKIKMLAVLVPSEAVREHLFRASPLCSDSFLAVFGVPRLLLDQRDLCLTLHRAFSLDVCLCPYFPIL